MEGGGRQTRTCVCRRPLRIARPDPRGGAIWLLRHWRSSVYRPGLRRDLLIVIAVAWVPLLIIALIEGRAIDGARESFLEDLNAQVRLLIALPLLLAAEPLIHS